MKRILITGADGQLGHEINELLSEDHHVIATSHKELDITDYDALEYHFNNNSYDVVVNCAAYTNVDGAEINEDQCDMVNAIGVKNLAHCCKNNGIKMIHISTDYIYGNDKRTPYTETDVPNPINIYGQSKLKGEIYAHKELGDDLIIIRTSWIYSAHGHNFVRTIINAAQDHKPIRVVNDQIGTPTSAEDLAIVIRKFIESDIWHNGIYNFSNEGAISWYDMAEFIVRTLDMNCDVLPISTDDYINMLHNDTQVKVARRPSYSVMSKKKICDVLNITIPHWYDALIRTLDMIRS